MDTKKEILIVLLVTLINASIAFFLTNILGIQNVVVFENYLSSSNGITYEILFFAILSIIEACFYERFFNN